MVSIAAAGIGVSGTIPYSKLPPGQDATPPAPGDAMTPATDLRVATVSIRGPQQAVWIDINTKTGETEDGGFLSTDGKGDLVAGQASLTKTATGEDYALELFGISVDDSNGAANPTPDPTKPSPVGGKVDIKA
jgi:hypothetical protein